MWAQLALEQGAVLTTANPARNFEITENLTRGKDNIGIYIHEVSLWQLGRGKEDAVKHGQSPSINQRTGEQNVDDRLPILLFRRHCKLR